MNDKILDRILKAEGGYTNDPQDSGGPTNWGITQGDYAAFKGHAVSAEDVKNMPLADAKAIYKNKYWDAMGLDQFTDERIQLCFFDQGVNRGIKTAAIQAQQIANTFNAKLTVDGKLGGVSAAKINAINPIDFCREYLQASMGAYVDIVKRKPSQIVFLRGWLNRIFALEDAIFVGSIEKAELPPVAKVDRTPEPAPAEKKDEKPIPILPLPANPVWLDEAHKYEGKKEQDSVFNRWLSGFWRIVGLANYKTIAGTSFAWCGLFVAVMLNVSGLSWQKDGAGAKNWAKYGVAIEYKTQGIPAGAIIWIDHDGDCKGGGNHVTFGDGDCTAEDLKKFAQVPGFGGNQGDTAKRSMYPTRDICAVRWPSVNAKGEKVPLPALPVLKSRNCTGTKSPGKESTTMLERFEFAKVA